MVGYLIRKTVDESPVFKEMQLRKSESSAPLGQLVRTNKREVVLAALIFAGNNAAGYLVIAFFASYGTKVLGMSRADTLAASLIGGLGWLIFTMFGGWISDRLGPKHALLVTVLAEHFCTPRMTMQKWEHSTTTATPRCPKSTCRIS